MQIGIVGAGRVGRALGGRWAAAGHAVRYGVRDPADPRHHDLAGVTTVPDAVAGVDAVLVALPWPAVPDVVPGLDTGDAVVIDATNPRAAGDTDPRSGAVTSWWTSWAGLLPP